MSALPGTHRKTEKEKRDITSLRGTETSGTETIETDTKETETSGTDTIRAETTWKGTIRRSKCDQDNRDRTFGRDRPDDRER